MPRHRKRKSKHVFAKYPAEIFYKILPFLHIRDLVALQQVNRWMYHNIINLKLVSYNLLSIKKDENDEDEKKFIYTPLTSTYLELREKLQSPIKKQMVRIVARVEREKLTANAGSHCSTYQAMKALALLVSSSALPYVAGELLDQTSIKMDEVFGFTGGSVGYFISLTLLCALVAWILKMIYDARHEISDESVELVQEDSITVKPLFY